MASFSRPRATFRMATSCEPLEAVGCAAMLCWAMVSQPARMAIAEADRVSLPVAPRKLRRVAANRVSIMLDMSVLRIWVEQTNYNRRYALKVQIGFKQGASWPHGARHAGPPRVPCAELD